MKSKITTVFLLFCVCHQLIAQNNDTISSEDSDFSPLYLFNDSIKQPFVFSPSVSFGVGMLSFFGDLTTKDQQPFNNSKMGYSISISNSIAKHLLVDVHFLAGKLVANENVKHNDRELINFESKIRSGGVSFQYNFSHWIPNYKSAIPFISLGLNVFSFKSNMDATDQYGNQYYYWTDGTIRNIDESAANASNAIELKRDYKYESDIRSMKLERDDYKEVSAAVPIGLGVMFKMNDYLDIKLGTTINFTFTDYIDGVTFTSKNNRQGNNKYDHFLMSYCALQYNFSSYKKDNTIGHYKEVDFVAIDTIDFDGDGVKDLLDSCQGTPKGVAVDLKGCPLDDDHDNIPNYMDKELATPKDAIVDDNGVQLSPEEIEKRFNDFVAPSTPVEVNRSGKPIAKTSKNTESKSQVTAEENQKVVAENNSTLSKTKSVAPASKTQNTTGKAEQKAPKTKAIVSAPENSIKTEYTVEKGDNLTIISKNNACSIKDLKNWNNLKSSSIREGQKLTIYKKIIDTNQKTYIMKEGDSLSSIAKLFGCSVSDLLNWNGSSILSSEAGSTINISKP